MTSFLNPALICDFYKLSHRAQYPQGTELVYSTWTPRGSRLPGVDKVVVFGAQMAMFNLDFTWKEQFFNAHKEDVIDRYKDIVSQALGVQDPYTKHLEDLHDLGYLPICVRSLPEGLVTPLRVPHLTIHNTDSRFFWLTNYLETFLSTELWQPATSATLAHEFRKLLSEFARDTVGNQDFVPYQGHDFSMRGMSSVASAVSSGLGHLVSFLGTDTIPAIEAAQLYYRTEELVGTSVPATEHSVQCAYGDDYEYIKRIITEVHPSGLVSVVSDGYDFWEVMEVVLLQLKDEIMARDGKVVIRPDSGDPVDIVCGDENAAPGAARMGAVEALWHTFGGTINKLGFKELDPHVGLIYGDAITKERAWEILQRLKDKGFASTNIVFGVGSFTYQYNTRDTFGWAMKSTFCQIAGQGKAIYKTPKTDDGTKHSLRGRVAVYHDLATNGWKVEDGIDHIETLPGDMLRTLFENGKYHALTKFEDIRARLRTQP